MIISEKSWKSYNRGHLYSAAGAFFPKTCSKNNENMRNSKKSWKSYNRGHLYSAAGAFSPNKCSTNHEKYEKSKKYEKP